MITRFNFLEQNTAKNLLDNHRRALFASTKGIKDRIIEAVTKEESRVINTADEALAMEASEAVESLASGINYGYLTSNIIITDKNIENGRERLKYIINYLNKLGFVAKEETLNNPFAFVASIPGNTNYNVRKSLVGTVNFSHFFPLSAKWQGDRANSHLKEVTSATWPHLVCPSDGGIFNLNLNIGDVGHTLIFGATGSGKSILLGTLSIAW
jgi:type IV secretion system protein VirB4